MISIRLVIAGCALVGSATVQAATLPLDTLKIHQVSGTAGTWNAEEGVYKLSFPRTDVKVRVDGWEMPPFMGLTSWAGFEKGTQNEAMVMGDLVLFQDEVNPVMSVALNNGLEVTALHNHFFYDEPKVYFMHIEGDGRTDSLARAIRLTQDQIRSIRSTSPIPASSFTGDALTTPSSINGQSIEAVLGYKGMAKDGMFKVTIGRTTTMSCGCPAGKEMGVNTWAGFAGSNDHAVVDGDFVVREGELQSVLKTLRAAKINIVAIHHHMIEEEPHYLFLHYWGKGKAVDLAQAVRTALDKATDLSTGGTPK